MADVLKHQGNFHWKGVEVLDYKNEGTHFQSVTRQILSKGHHELPAELRYFEIAPAGYSTLERHEHEHLIVVLKGRGQALSGAEIVTLDPFDVVRIPSGVWHQFRASRGEPLGFLCLVHKDRDRPQRPEVEQLAQLQSDPVIAAFVRS